MKVKLNRGEIEEYIRKGANGFGDYYMAVVDGEANIFWHETNTHHTSDIEEAQWIGLPSLWEPGESQEWDEFSQMLKDLQRVGSWHRISEGRAAVLESISKEEGLDAAIEALDEKESEEWQERLANRIEWLVEGFLAACNGDGSDLNMEFPWGEKVDEWGGPTGKPKAPPAEFEWE